MSEPLNRETLASQRMQYFARGSVKTEPELVEDPPQEPEATAAAPAAQPNPGAVNNGGCMGHVMCLQAINEMREESAVQTTDSFNHVFELLENIQGTLATLTQRNATPAAPVAVTATSAAPAASLIAPAASAPAAVDEDNLPDIGYDPFDFGLDDGPINGSETGPVKRNYHGSCGVCHEAVRDSYDCLVPCGHFPYCKDCIKSLKENKESTPLLARLESYDDCVMYCPFCQVPTTKHIEVKILKPFADECDSI